MAVGCPVGGRQAGADIHLIGQQWRPGPGSRWPVVPVRLETLTPGLPQLARLRRTGYDLLIVGHEYPSLPAWREAWRELGCDLATFQHDPDFRHADGTFDDSKVRLYCYSAEMTARYAAHRPRTELAVHLGFADQPQQAAQPGDELVWIGRIDEDKAPHIAIIAARLAGRRIHVIGPVFDPSYVKRHASLFRASHVRLAGELGGTRKTAALQAARVLVYTCARRYTKAGAAVFGEALRAGTPVAALAWRPGTCADAALCTRTGTIAAVPPHATDAEAAAALAGAIEAAAQLPHADVHAIGQERFSPASHFCALAARPC